MAETEYPVQEELALQTFLPFFRYDGYKPHWQPTKLIFGPHVVPIVNGIPRFIESGATYSEGNFSRLRERHATLQLDSVNGTSDRRDTLLTRTGWSPSRITGKTILECGCGVGPDTEVLLSLGAKVLSVDLTGLDIAKKNLRNNDDVCFVQADIANLPLIEKSFDIVFCHRVLQHTPDPAYTLAQVLRYVKPGGDVFVHSYARTAKQMLNWKYALRPLTKRMPAELLYKSIEKAAPSLGVISEHLCRSSLGRKIHYMLVPFRYYGHLPQYRDMPKEEILEYGVHDTFDALSPKYDRPLSEAKMREIATDMLDRSWETHTFGTVTVLRTK